MEDKSIIETRAMLNDRHMLAAHKMLGKEFSHYLGLQSPLLCQTGGFEGVLETSGFFPDGMLGTVQYASQLTNQVYYSII